MTAPPLIRLEEQLLRAGDGINEDRVGLSGALAWAIDGATDVVARPLTPGPTDAAWFAERLDAALRAAGTDGAPPLLDALLRHVTEQMAAAFDAARTAEPEGPQDLPSAAGALLQREGARIAFLRLGDCRALWRPPGGRVVDLGARPGETAPDRRMGEELRAALAAFGGPSAPALWRAARPTLHAARRSLNQPDGYGVFSTIAPPPAFVRAGAIDLVPGGRVLLTTDGLMRLVELFEAHDLDSFFDAAARGGLTALADDVRMREAGDPDGSAAPRIKDADDLGALLLSFP